MDRATTCAIVSQLMAMANHVCSSQALIHESWLVRCSPPASRFSQSNQYHHKQHLLIATSKISHCLHQFQITVKKCFTCNHKFHTPPHPTSKAHSFLTARRRSKENLSVPGATQENLESTLLHIKSLFPGST